MEILPEKGLDASKNIVSVGYSVRITLYSNCRERGNLDEPAYNIVRVLCVFTKKSKHHGSGAGFSRVTKTP